MRRKFHTQTCRKLHCRAIVVARRSLDAADLVEHERPSRCWPARKQLTTESIASRCSSHTYRDHILSRWRLFFGSDLEVDRPVRITNKHRCNSFWVFSLALIREFSSENFKPSSVCKKECDCGAFVFGKFACYIDSRLGINLTSIVLD